MAFEIVLESGQTRSIWPFLTGASVPKNPHHNQSGKINPNELLGPEGPKSPTRSRKLFKFN